MLFLPTPVDGAWIIEPEPHRDERGSFARIFSAEEFRARGLADRVDECSISFNPRSGTLRGLHYQRDTHPESRLARCTRGAIFDVIVDLRAASASYLRWFGTRLDPQRGQALFVPAGCAHGFLTLADDSEVLYQMSGVYVPSAAAGVRWDDPAFGIEWPASPSLISARDASYPDYAVPS